MVNNLYVIIQIIIHLATQKTQNIRITSVHRRPNVFDVGWLNIVHMVYKCFVFTGYVYVDILFYNLSLSSQIIVSTA